MLPAEMAPAHNVTWRQSLTEGYLWPGIPVMAVSGTRDVVATSSRRGSPRARRLSTPSIAMAPFRNPFEEMKKANEIKRAKKEKGVKDGLETLVDKVKVRWSHASEWQMLVPPTCVHAQVEFETWPSSMAQQHRPAAASARGRVPRTRCDHPGGARGRQRRPRAKRIRFSRTQRGRGVGL